MSKGIRITFVVASLIVALTLVAFVNDNKLLSDTTPPSAPFQGWNQWKIDSPMPDTLDVDYLLSLPKYRNIHHDSFCRDDNFNEIGNNALPERPEVMAYKTMTHGKINVGIKNGRATNFSASTQEGRCIKYINAGRDDYHITAIRSNESASNIGIAFLIHDIDNFYYTTLSDKEIVTFHYRNGIKKKTFKRKIGGERLEAYVNGRSIQWLVDGKRIKVLNNLGSNIKETLCGLYFDNTGLSEVEDFIVDYPDIFDEVGIDEFVENGQVSNPQYGTYWALENKCTTSETYTNNSKKSYRFELTKPYLKTGEKASDKAVHSTLMLDGITVKGGNNYCGQAGGNKPLDSFVLSVDVLFPCVGDEKWELDELFQELIIQEHHVGYGIPFSPSISININKGRLYLNTIWMEHVARGTSFTDNDLHYRGEYVGRINSDKEETYLANKGYDNYNYLPFLERGKWHNITLYVKLGYNTNQRPRTVLYLDSIKVADWNTPNAYNCQEYGEYMEFGVYKWSWDKQEYRDKTPIKKRVIYFDNIHYYI